MRSTYGKQLRYGYATLEVSEKYAPYVRYEPTDDVYAPCPLEKGAEMSRDIIEWKTDILGYVSSHVRRDHRYTSENT